MMSIEHMHLKFIWQLNKERIDYSLECSISGFLNLWATEERSIGHGLVLLKLSTFRKRKLTLELQQTS